jgi:hypothetical protein
MVKMKNINISYGKIHWVTKFDAQQQINLTFRFVRYINPNTNQIDSLFVPKHTLVFDTKLCKEDTWVSFFIKNTTKVSHVDLFSFDKLQSDDISDFINKYRLLLSSSEYNDLVKYDIARGEEAYIEYLRKNQFSLLLKFLKIEEVLKNKECLDFVKNLIECRESLDQKVKQSVISYFMSDHCDPEFFKICIKSFDEDDFRFIKNQKDDRFNQYLVSFTLMNVEKPYQFLLYKGFFDLLGVSFFKLNKNTECLAFFSDCLKTDTSFNRESVFNLDHQDHLSFFIQFMFSDDLKIKKLDHFVPKSLINREADIIDSLKIKKFDASIYIDYLKNNQFSQLLKFVKIEKVLSRRECLDFVKNLIAQNKSLDNFNHFFNSEYKNNINASLISYFMSNHCDPELFKICVQSFDELVFSLIIEQKGDLFAEEMIYFMIAHFENYHELLVEKNLLPKITYTKNLIDDFRIYASRHLFSKFDYDDFQLISLWLTKNENKHFFKECLEKIIDAQFQRYLGAEHIKLSQKIEKLIKTKRWKNIDLELNLKHWEKYFSTYHFIRLISARYAEIFAFNILKNKYKECLVTDISIEQIKENSKINEWNQYDLKVQLNQDILKKYDVKTARMSFKGSFSEFLIKDKKQEQNHIKFIGCLISYIKTPELYFNIDNKELVIKDEYDKYSKSIIYLGESVFDIDKILETTNCILQESIINSKQQIKVNIDFIAEKKELDLIQIWVFDSSDVVYPYVKDYVNIMQKYSLNKSKIFKKLSINNLNQYLLYLYSYQLYDNPNKKIEVPITSNIGLLSFFQILTCFMQKLNSPMNKPIIYMSILTDFLLHCISFDENYSPESYLYLFNIDNNKSVDCYTKKQRDEYEYEYEGDDLNMLPQKFIAYQPDFSYFFLTVVRILNKVYQKMKNNLIDQSYKSFKFSPRGILKAVLADQKTITIYTYCGGKSLLHSNACGNQNINFVDHAKCNHCHLLICDLCGTCYSSCANVNQRRNLKKQSNKLKEFEDLALHILNKRREKLIQNNSTYNTKTHLPFDFIIDQLIHFDESTFSKHTSAKIDEINTWQNKSKELAEVLSLLRQEEILIFLRQELSSNLFSKIKLIIVEGNLHFMEKATSDDTTYI